MVPRAAIVALCIFMFFPLQSFLMLGETNAIWKTIYYCFLIARCAIACFAIVDFIASNSKFDALLVALIVLEFVMCVSTMMNGSFGVSDVFSVYLSTMGFFMFCENRRRIDSRELFNSAYYLFGLLVVIGTICIFIYPDGFNHAGSKGSAIFLFGSKNTAFFYYWIFLYLDSRRSYLEESRISIRTICLNAFFIAGTLVCNSINGTIMLILLLFYLIGTRCGLDLNWLSNTKTLTIAFCLVALSVFLANSDMMKPVFDLIGRDQDFTGRTFLWNQAINMIAENPLFGNGANSLYRLTSDTVEAYAVQAHNVYLDYASKYGLIAMLLLVVFYIRAMFECKQCNKNAIGRLGSFFVFIFMIHALFDAASLFHLIIVISITRIVGQNVPGMRGNHRGK